MSEDKFKQYYNQMKMTRQITGTFKIGSFKRKVYSQYLKKIKDKGEWWKGRIQV
jgi:hypothetical protein